MKTYARYKDSGISWIGDVPEHWNCLKIKRLFDEDDEKNENGEFELLSFSKNKGLIYYKDNNEKEPSAGDLTKYRVVHKGQLLENRMQAWHGMFICVDKEGCVSPDYSVFNANKRTVGSVKYYEYCFRLPMWVQQFANESRGIGDGFNRLYTSQFHKIMAIVPPPSEQKAIAEYLDKKTAQINELVSAKQKQIELLKEYKQSVIANAVTGKIDERREKRKWKDSGISWIGKIPENWEVDKLGHRFIQRKEKVSDKDYPPLSVSKMGVTPQLESACKTDDGDNRKLVLKGDFVVNSRSDRKGSCGLSELDGSVSLINIVATPRNIDGHYIHYLFRSNNYIEEFYRMGRGIVADLWTTRWSEMRTIMIPVPPLSEQKEIVAYIEKKISSIDFQIVSIENQIANLNEYKQSLISDVVTGKVKV